MGSVLIDLQKIRFKDHLLLEDLQVDQLEDPGNLRPLILDVQKLRVIGHGRIFSEYEMADLCGQIMHADRIRIFGGEGKSGGTHLFIPRAALPEPAQQKPERADPNLQILRVQEPPVEAEQKLFLVRTAQIVRDLRQAVQKEEACKTFPARGLVVLQDHIQDIAPFRAVTHGQKRADDTLHAVTDPAPVLFGYHMAREQHPVEKGTPHVDHSAPDSGRGDIFGELFFEGDVKPCHHFGGDPRALPTDIPVMVGEHLIQEVENHQLLILRKIPGVFLDNGQKCAHVPPVLFAADIFQKTDEGSIMAGGVHDLQVL